jgi:hypothetical protein
MYQEKFKTSTYLTFERYRGHHGTDVLQHEKRAIDSENGRNPYYTDILLHY